MEENTVKEMVVDIVSRSREVELLDLPKEMIAMTTTLAELNIRCPYIDIGMDLEDEFDMSIDGVAFDTLRTVGAVVTFIEDLLKQRKGA